MCSTRQERWHCFFLLFFRAAAAAAHVFSARCVVDDDPDVDRASFSVQRTTRFAEELDTTSAAREIRSRRLSCLGVPPVWW